MKFLLKIGFEIVWVKQNLDINLRIHCIAIKLCLVTEFSIKPGFTSGAQVELSAFPASRAGFPLLHQHTPLVRLFPCSWQSRLLAEQLPPFSHTTPVLLSSPSSSFSVVTILTKPHLEWNQKNISESFSLTKKADNLRHGEGTSKEWFCLCELLLCHCDQSGWSEDPSVGRPRWKLTQAVGMIRRRRSEPTSRDVPTERPPSFFYP